MSSRAAAQSAPAQNPPTQSGSPSVTLQNKKSNPKESKESKKKKTESVAADNSVARAKALYYRAMKDLKKGRHEIGRLTLQTLINTYPDSEFLADAKLAIADSYYREGGSANL